MRNSIGLFATVAIAVTLTAAGAARANVTKYTDQGTFEALGVIDQKTDFDAFDPTKNTSVGDPYVTGLLTISSDDNIVSGYQSPPPQVMRNMIFNDAGDTHSISGEIAGVGHNLFAFKNGDLLQGTGWASMTMFMDGGLSASFAVTNPVALDAIDFHGLQASAGHYFTGFEIRGNTDFNVFSVIGLTDFEIGHTGGRCIDTSIACGGGGPPDGCIDTSHPCGGGVPEPTPWALMIMGFGGVGAVIRRRHAAIA